MPKMPKMPMPMPMTPETPTSPMQQTQRQGPQKNTSVPTVGTLPITRKIPPFAIHPTTLPTRFTSPSNSTPSRAHRQKTFPARSSQQKPASAHWWTICFCGLSRRLWLLARGTTAKTGWRRRRYWPKCVLPLVLGAWTLSSCRAAASTSAPQA
ncbi:predicted protein [Clavispora lusitaniae ATCC 42720]|uniref:Uncharacterized protein n=1 Tax=Clavispora lusitaniae (strain ATCC 42720) TaxID=306902 RepID=C4Y361_CLAL4|nr:uncharacterized protein CLUG_02974 [Clavispora lusitaniae ATCC 42720]EEQ38847.1 predicted protein [Clavispora lusitaniae ATCC 42720]